MASIGDSRPPPASDPGGPGRLSRRELLRRSAVAGATVGLGGLLGSCGSVGGPQPGRRPGAGSIQGGRFEPSAGAEIPTARVRFAMAPFGDTTIGFIGIQQGFFGDVGLQLVPTGGETRLLQQIPGELLSGQLDIASDNMALLVQSFPQQPEIRMIQLHDAYVGNYLLARPGVGAKTYADFARLGESFEAAARSTVRQISGRRIALSTVGTNRDFFTTLLGFGGLKPTDVKLVVVDDAKILQLARAGQIDFAMPAGAAQNVVLMNEGFFRIFGVRDLLANLAPGDPRAVDALGDGGIVATDAYVNANIETVLRFQSVFYRIIDQLRSDPDTALAMVLPHLNAVTGLTLTLRDCKVVFSQFYEFISFEQMADHLLNRKFPLQIDNVYTPQIAAAERGGIYPAGTTVTPEKIFIGTRLYEILADLKARYEALRRSGGSNGAVAAKAHEQYTHRNYLDAYRLLRATAVG